MRHVTVMLMIAIAVSGRGEEDTTDLPVTTEATVSSGTPDAELTTSTLTASTTQAPESTTTTKAPIVGGVTTRHDDGCAYEGPTEFDVNSDVTFTFINATEILDMGFQVHKIDEGTTIEAIYEFGEGQVSYQGEDEEEDDCYEPYLPTPTTPGVEYVLTFSLDKVGLHAIVCFQHPEDPESDEVFPNYASTLFTVEG